VSDRKRERHLTRLGLPRVGSFCLLTAAGDTVVGASIREKGIWEPAETSLLIHAARAGDRVVDVGAHVGYFTVLASKLVGEKGQVLAFEPERDNFELLKANCVLNGCRNVRLEQAGLLDRHGQASLALCLDNSGDHRFGPTMDRRARMVEIIRFDDWWRMGGQIDFLKIDVQGCEVAALRGMTVSVRQSAVGLAGLVEISPRLSQAAGYGWTSLLALLQGLGALAYRAALIAGTLRLEPLDEAELARSWSDLLQAARDDAGTNLLLFFTGTARDRWLHRLREGLGPALELRRPAG
jgi:FkbM family methyltransferase